MKLDTEDRRWLETVLWDIAIAIVIACGGNADFMRSIVPPDCRKVV